MSRFVFTRTAQRELEEIWEYIAQDNVDAADRVLEAIEGACRLLAENPELGHYREDLAGKPVRFWPVESYLVIYRPDTKPIQVLRIGRGSRDWAALLG